MSRYFGSKMGGIGRNGRRVRIASSRLSFFRCFRALLWLWSWEAHSLQSFCYCAQLQFGICATSQRPQGSYLWLASQSIQSMPQPPMPPTKPRNPITSPSIEQKKRTILQLRSAILEYSDRVQKKAQELKEQRVNKSKSGHVDSQGWHKKNTSIFSKNDETTLAPTGMESLAAFGGMLKVDLEV